MAHCGVPAENVEFCDEFFPRPDKTSAVEPKVRTTNPFAKLAGASTDHLLEKVVAETFTAAINDNNLAPGLKIAQCGDRPDPAVIDNEQQKIDAAFYRADLAPTDGRPHWGDQLVAVEFKRHATSLDPFDDDKDNISTDTDTRKKVRGQIITYAELVFAVQQRVALFMLVVIGRNCRFVRWDRSGTVVTRALDYVLHWEFFCDILWRISICSDTQLGLDPSATILHPSDLDYIRMDAVALKDDSDVDQRERALRKGEVLPDHPFEYVRTMFRDSLVAEWPRFKLEVPYGEDTREFLVCKPRFRAKGMTGRGTRGYVALDRGTGKFVWLKDAWRSNYVLLTKEGDVLAELNKAKIANVPTLVCHGDILEQTTVTPDWWERKNPPLSAVQPDPLSSTRSSSRTFVVHLSSMSFKRKRVEEPDDDVLPSLVSLTSGDVDSEAGFRENCPLRLHKHYRLVVEEVAMPLHQFKYPRQLVSIIYDCLLAHCEAATNPLTNLLHRDISAGNILMYPKVVEYKRRGVTFLKWVGILADWEMSKPIPDGNKPRKRRQPERTGTWQFMSRALLSPGPYVVMVADELESIFHVLLYHAVRYLPSNCDGNTVATYIDSYFDMYGLHGDAFICGDKKWNTIKNAELEVVPDLLLEFNSPMDGLLSKMLTWFSARYRVLNYERQQKNKENGKVAPLTAEPGDSGRASSPPPDDDNMPPLDDDMPPLDDNDDHSGDDGDSTKGRPAQYIPTAWDRELAQQVSIHQPMISAFRAAFAATWDKTGKWDRIPANWKPPNRGTHTQTLVSSAHVSKKQKVKPRLSGVNSNPFPAVRVPVTPPRRTVQHTANTMWRSAGLADALRPKAL